MRVCEFCKEGFELASTGRPPRYCSSTCRKNAWHARQTDEAVAGAVARALAAERRRVANRGNETPGTSENRGNETPPQAGPVQPQLPLPDPRLRLARPPAPAPMPPGPSLRQRRRLLPPPPGTTRDAGE